MSSYFDTPIAEAAERASRIIHRTGLEELPKPPSRRMFSVANQKGGVGKTTTAVNLAAALALYGMHVLVVDLDPQGNASTALGAEHRSGTPSSYELLLGECTLEECIQKSTAGEGVFVVPATIDLAGSEIELVSMVAREKRLKDALDDSYLDELGIDFVFIDCPPSLGLLTINAMVAADEILLPIQCEYYALEGVQQLMRTVTAVKQAFNPDLSIETIVMTMYDARTNLSQQVTAEVRAHFSRETLDTVIPRSVRVSEAPSYTRSVLTYEPHSSGARAYRDAAAEFAHRHAQ